MSDNLVNDVKRLERISDELSGTNQKLLGSATRIITLIIKAVPYDMYHDDLGMGYRVINTKRRYLDMSLQCLALIKGRGIWRKLRFEFYNNSVRGHDDLNLWETHIFADDVANGLLGQICDKLNQYLIRANHRLGMLEQGEVFLKKNLPPR